MNNHLMADKGPKLADELLAFARHHGLIEDSDIIFIQNQMLDLLQISEPYSGELDPKSKYIPEYATPILEKLLDYCFEKGLIKENTPTHRDLMDTRIMGIFMSRPSDVIKRFFDTAHNDGIEAATDYFYHLCQRSDYIRMERIARNLKWEYDSPYGALEITINLTKPEKDPKEIAALKNAPQSGYPKCLLCPENVGYSGRLNHPARQTHRTIPLELYGETWQLQYSPYVYYNEHCIVLKSRHVPMKLTKETFIRLFEFIDTIPHYFIGSNADLPIVGGSILNHDHFQGGHYEFPMERAKEEYSLKMRDYPNVQAAVVSWPMSVIRLRSEDSSDLVELGFEILEKWREYSDSENEILAHTINENGVETPHNTITPIARKRSDGCYELDLVLRNNRVSNEHPLGIFHPHKELHHIKKENIGLIEVMGLFILPGRLQSELKLLENYLTGNFDCADDINSDDHPLHHHSEWLNWLIEKYGSSMTPDEAQSVLRKEVGAKCQQVLADAGVFKADAKGRAGFYKFLTSFT